MKMVSLYKNGLLSYDIIFFTFTNLLNIMMILIIRNKYCYKREQKHFNVLLTAFWHYYMSMVLCNVSHSMFIDANKIK